jgi:GntR family transcriptional regulator
MPARFHVRTASGLPIYRQLMDQIERQAASGLLRAGDPLPSVRELSRDLGINPATVVKAYAELERAGRVESRQGLGTFVAAATAELPRAEKLRRLSGAAETLMVEALQLGLDEQEAHRAVDEAAVKLRGARRRRDG